MPEFLTLMIELLFSYLVSGVKVQGAPYFKRHFSSLILKNANTCTNTQNYAEGSNQSILKKISPSNEYSGLISFRIVWLDLLAVQGALKSLL